MERTRRGIIKHLTGIAVGFGNISVVNGGISDRNKEYQKQSRSHENMVTLREPDMYMALPGFSLSSFIMNIPQLHYTTSSPTPIIFDRHDWDRLRGKIVTRDDDYQAQRLGLMFNQLYQQGLIKLFDYRKYYPKQIQTKNIKQTRELLSSISDHDNRNAAVATATRFLDYGLGEYQDSLRKSLDNLSWFVYRRRLVNKALDGLDSGVGDEERWNERVINQYLAALEVRRSLERELNSDIQCIGQNESGAIDSLIAEHDGSGLPYTLQHTTGRLSNQFYEFDVEDTTLTLDVSDQISTIAQEVAGIENNHWFVFGPRLAMVKSGDTYSRARSHIRHNSIKSITSEAMDLYSRLEDHRENNRTVEFLNYEADYLMEQNDLTHTNRQRLFDELRAETALSNYSRDIDDLAHDYSPAAKTVVESILMDPLNRYTEDDVYREAVNLMRMIEPVSLSDEQLETFKYRGAFRRGEDNGDWYQEVNRSRGTA